MNVKLLFLLALLVTSSLQIDAQRNNRRTPRKSSAQRTVKATMPQEEKSATDTKRIASENNLPVTYSLNNITFTMVPVKGGTFAMGATKEQPNAKTDEQPIHNVTIDNYMIGQTEVTQSLWRTIMNDNNDSYFHGDNLPVEQVSWNDCQLLLQKLNSAFESQTHGKHFRLPTEAEWEYAARGGDKAKTTIYSGDDIAEEVAWFFSNSDFSTHTVASKKPNELGLYDMSGNVAEWCQDWYSATYYDESTSTNPSGPVAGKNRVIRGGAWGRNNAFLRVCSRSYETPDTRQNYIGLRLVLSE